MYSRMHSIAPKIATTTNLLAFTLVETMVAVAVLTISIVGPFQIVQGVLQNSYLVRDQLIAGALAQEGMEYVRAIRDSNYIYANHNATTRAWLYGLDGSTGPNCYTSACVLDPTQDGTANAVIACGDATCATRPLYLSTANLYNQQVSGTQTRFTRKVQLTNVSATETMVTVTVTWSNHGTRTVVLVENMRDWL